MKKNIKYFVLVALVLFAFQKASAAIEIGSGTNSFTAGRYIPSLDLAYSTNDQVFALSSTGVRNSYYYQASHQAAYFVTWPVGDMWGADMSSGFGGAFAYSVRSFKDTNETTEKKVTDYLAGPAIRMNLTYGFVYLNMTATFGLRNLAIHLGGLTFQDVETVSLGVRF